jgi:uncharacterized protein (TIGR02231 family)
MLILAPPSVQISGARLLRASLLGLTSVLAVTAAQAATLEATSRVGEVTLYPDAAIIKRQLTLDIPAGEHEIQLNDLPASLDPASLRVEGSAGGRVVIGNVDFRARATGPDGDRSETPRKIKALRVERDRVSDKIDAAENRKAMIQRLAQGSAGESKDGNLDLDQWTKALDLVGRNLQAVNDELRGLRLEIERIDGEIAALEPPADRLRPVPRDVKRTATLGVEAAGATSLTLTVSYRVSGAGWRPVYDARLETRGAAPGLELTRRAMIRQNTGEDWNEAKLTLSTLPVMRGTAAPVLTGEKIGFLERPMPRVAMPMAAPAPQATAQMMRDALEAETSQKSAAVAPAQVIEEAKAQVEASAYQAEFQVPGTLSLPSGGAEKSIRLGVEKPEPKVIVRAAPVLDPTAYLEASFEVGGEVPILPGEVLLSRDGAYIGRGRLPLVAPGETARLGFGSDDRIRIARVPASRKTRDPGFLGSTRSDRFEFRTSVKNLHAFPVSMVIEDRIPVSEDQAITVERLPDMTKPDAEIPENRRGVILWTPTLKPQEERAYVTAYRLRWPANRETRLTPLPQ